MPGHQWEKMTWAEASPLSAEVLPPWSHQLKTMVILCRRCGFRKQVNYIPPRGLWEILKIPECDDKIVGDILRS
jgi:hypothetical protein